MINHHEYLDRCVALADLANKHTKSNPKVGAVIVYYDRIIGEGYHEYYGGPHAEVNAINNVKESDQHLIPLSTIYISLEPCNIFGKTPPCTNLILEKGIKKVVIGQLDPNPKMNGSSIEFLHGQRCDVQVINHDGCKNLIRKFSKNLQRESFIILKWAQTSDNFIGVEGQQIKITNHSTDIMMHRLRGEVDGILVGKNTALIDNPSLTTRHYPGENPVRILIDDRLEVPTNYKIFSQESNTIVFNQLTDKTEGHITYITYDKSNPKDILKKLYELNIYSCLVEGGAKILNYFIINGIWDEAVIVSSKHNLAHDGREKTISAPLLHGSLSRQIEVGEDLVQFIVRDRIKS